MISPASQTEQAMQSLKSLLTEGLRTNYGHAVTDLPRERVVACASEYLSRLPVKDAVVTNSGVVTTWKQRRDNALEFYDQHRGLMEYRVPRIKGRRLQRVWAKSQVGKIWVYFSMTPLMPIETISVKVDKEMLCAAEP